MRVVPLFLALLACDPNPADSGIVVDETGYLDAARVFYTATEPIDGARALTVLGLSGAFDPPSGALAVDGATSVTAPDADGAFRVQLTATVGDVVSLRYTPPGEVERVSTLPLADDLTGLTAPAVGSSAPIERGTDGTVVVAIPDLAAGSPPFIVYNEAGGLPVFSDGSPVQIDASPGDRVCVFSVDPAQALQSTALCLVAP